MALTGQEPSNVIGSVLSRRFLAVGDVVKVGKGIWGLKEWYPNRNFKPTGKTVAIVTGPGNESAFVSDDDKQLDLDPDLTAHVEEDVLG